MHAMKKPVTKDDLILAALNIVFTGEDGSPITRETFESQFELKSMVNYNIFYPSFLKCDYFFAVCYSRVSELRAAKGRQQCGPSLDLKSIAPPNCTASGTKFTGCF